VTLAPGRRITLLDGFSVSLGRGSPQPPPEDLPRGVQRLVAHLCLSGRPPRSAIAGQLWPDVREDHACASLRSALWRLQRVAPGLVEVSGGAVYLAADVRVDVRELSDWARRVRDPTAGIDASGSWTRRSAANCCPAGTTTGSCWNGSVCASSGCTPSRSPPAGSPRRAAMVTPCRPPTRRSARSR
jgi:hypothetical protein